MSPEAVCYKKIEPLIRRLNEQARNAALEPILGLATEEDMDLLATVAFRVARAVNRNGGQFVGYLIDEQAGVFPVMTRISPPGDEETYILAGPKYRKGLLANVGPFALKVWWGKQLGEVEYPSGKSLIWDQTDGGLVVVERRLPRSSDPDTQLGGYLEMEETDGNFFILGKTASVLANARDPGRVISQFCDGLRRAGAVDGRGA